MRTPGAMAGRYRRRAGGYMKGGLSFGHVHVMLVARPRVFGAGADEGVVGVLFEDVGDPAAGAADGEDGGEQVAGDVEVVVDGGGVEIDVGPEAPGPGDEFLDHDGHLVPMLLIGELAELAGHFAEVLGAGVAVFVDGVAEAMNMLPGLQAAADEGLDVVGMADFVERAHDQFVGPAMHRYSGIHHFCGCSSVFACGQCVFQSTVRTGWFHPFSKNYLFHQIVKYGSGLYQ